jgi:LPXTG-motif cell wall-anchored protein
VASVGNVGLALANTGLNGSFGNASPNAPPNPSPGVAATQPTTPVADTLARFLLPLTSLDWLNGPNPFTQLTASLDLQGVMLDLAGRFQGDTFGGRGVRVRQITGVVDISVAVADPPDARAAGATTGLATRARPVGALLRTGDATALGNRATVGVCQTVNDDAGCRPRVSDARRRPRSGPDLHQAGGVEASTVAASPQATTHAQVYVVTASLEVPGHAPAPLPATGSDTRALLEIGLMLLGSGTLLRVSQRRLR